MDSNKDTGKVYDLTTIYMISDNNPQFLEKLLLVFTENILTDMQAMKTAAAAGNWPEVGQLAHKIKPSLAHFGINSVKDVILGLERPATYDAQQLNPLVAKLDSVMNEVLQGLKNEFPNVFNK